jgi:uncharacterized repeat protein (TIGR01451 family)
VYAGESGTIGEAFGIGSAANYTATLACTGNASALSGSTLTIDPADTAIVCTETNTSNLAVSGFVYNDTNHTGSRDGTEVGTGLAGLWVKLAVRAGLGCASPALATALVDPGSGGYNFATVSPGDYCLILDTNSLVVDTTATYPFGWLGTEAPTGILPVTVVSSSPALQNFGLFHGSVLTGKVFTDTGAGGGTANDGAANGMEAGIAGVSVRLTDGLGSTVSATTTDGSGSYRLHIPGNLSTGSVLSVVEINPPAHISTGARVGTTAGLYDRTTDAMTFTLVAGTAYADVNFGDIPSNQFFTDGSQTALPGAAVFYPHSFTAGSAGTVDFLTAALGSPALPGWSEVLYRDTNCNALPDAGEPQITGAVSLATGEQVCILVKEFVPASAPFNAQNTVTVTAAFAYSGANPALVNVSTHSDVTTVGQAVGAGLSLSKSVDKTTALPGALLVYTVTYTNMSSEPLGSIVVNDATPAFTTFVSAGCVGSPPADITACTVALQPLPGAQGPVRWTLSGTLAPGATGSVTYTVRVEN